MNGTVVVIPAFNEARTIAQVVADVCAQGADRVIVVDDGSSDETAARVSETAIDGLELIRHSRNLGKGFALTTGITRALELGATRIITIDADGQHNSSDIPRLVQAASLAPSALIIAARTGNREQAPPLRRFANETADFWISWACGQRINDTQSGFRLYPAEVLARLDLRPRLGQGFAFETALLIDAVGAGAAVRSTPIATRYHADARASHYRPWSDTWSIIRLVGGRLLRRGMYPSGLLRSLQRRARSGKDRPLSLGDSD